MRPLESLLAAAVAACDPAGATARALARPAVRRALDRRRVWIAAVGKAAAAMAAGAGGQPIAGGLVVVPRGAPAVPLAAALEVREASHPVPDAASEAAGRALLALAARVPADDVLLALISGGASALAAVPAPGLTLAAKLARTRPVAASGAPIAELNRVRTSLSAIKGGRLAAACAAPVVTLVVSDVVGDDLAVVGSGPTLPVRPGDLAVLASGQRALAEAAVAAAGRSATLVDAAVTGDVAGVAARVCATIRAALAGDAAGTLIWTGEPTVVLPARPGRGGRARQLALLCARGLAGVPGWTLLCAGSDGIDGSDDAAGAIVDGDTWDGIGDGDAALAACDAGTALAPWAVVTGPTGVNHGDLLVARIHPGDLGGGGAFPPDPQPGPGAAAMVRVAVADWTALKVLDWTARRFADAGVDGARLDAQVLLAHVLGCTRVQLYTGFDRPLDERELAGYRALIKRRLAGEPVAYLVGEQEFWSLPFFVDASVLVPRRDTETVIEVVRDQVGDRAAARTVVDACTGSGCIAVTLARELPAARVIATDLSPEAAAVAVRNAERNGVAERVEVRVGELLDPVRGDLPVDVLVANPPYVAAADLAGLSAEVRREPRLALDGGADGLDLIRRLVGAAPAAVAPGGLLVLEHGFDQAAAVAALIDATGAFEPAATRKDLGGQPRVTWARRR